MQRLRASRATTPSRGFITRAASALIFVGATALAFALPGDAAERGSTLTPSLSEWRDNGSPAPSEGHWLDADIGTFRITRGDKLQDRVLRVWQDRVHQEPERAASELHGLFLGGFAEREKIRDMLLNAAEGGEVMSTPDLNAWWASYSERYLLDLADAGLGEVVTYTEEQIQARLGFVRNVNLEYRSPLGGRTGHGALSFLGALREMDDSVLAWELRAYHNEDSDTGLNAGLIFRRAHDSLFNRAALLGANVFLDYQTHDAGGFWRYSLGGEIRTGALDLYGNYYIPISDDKPHDDDFTYYTAEGFNVEANIGVPSADWLSAVVGYYWWEGKGSDEHGNIVEDETGTKVGFRARPNSSWEFEFEYDIADVGDDEVGGRITYSRQIGNYPGFDISSRPFGGNFNPRNHFFDAVRREYAQRIRRYYTGASDPVVVPAHSRVASGQSVEFEGQITLAGADLTMLSPVALTGTTTINVTGANSAGDDNAIALGFGSEEPAGTVKFFPDGSASGMYVFDIPGRLVSVGVGGLFWDDPQAGWAQTAGGGNVSILLQGTAFSLSVTGGNMDAFALHEGKGEIDGGAASGAVISCESNEVDMRSANRETDFFTTKCYGDIEIFDAGIDGRNAGDQLVAIETPVVLVGTSGDTSFVMYGGRNDSGSPEVAFGQVGTMTALNNTDAGIRYVRMDGDFTFDGTAIGCDHETDTVLAFSGGVAAYCPQGLDAFVNVNVPPVGIANSGFAQGILLTLPNPLSGSGIDLSYAVNTPGYSLDENWVLSASSDAISALNVGPNTVQIQRNLGVIPGVLDSGIGDSVNVVVHKLSDGGKVIIRINQLDADAFPQGRQVSGDNEGFVFDNLDSAIIGAEDGDLPVEIDYNQPTNMFSLASGVSLAAVTSYIITVTVDTTNIRGVHELEVVVDVVDLAVIGSEFVVRPRANIAASGTHTGDIAGVNGANLRTASDPTGNVNITCEIVGSTDDFGISALSNGCQVDLTSPLGDAASKELTVRVVHTATDSYERSLLVPPFDTLQDNIAPRTVETVITVWKAEVMTPQPAGPVRSLNPINPPVSFDPPTNVGGIDFADAGANWEEVGISADNVTLMSNGDITGTPPSEGREYTIEVIANFTHTHLAGAFNGVVLELTVIDKPPEPATVMFSSGTNGTLIAVHNNTVLSSGDSVPAGEDIVFMAAPDGGYRVESWTDAAESDAACATAPSGHGGVRVCRVTAGDDADYNVAVAFESGGMHPDLTASPDSVAADIYMCMALGGQVLPDNTGLACAEYSGDTGFNGRCVIFSNLQGATQTCEFGFAAARDCNAQNQPATAVNANAETSTCGGACGSGEVAVGGACVSPPSVGEHDPHEVTFDPADVSAYRAYVGNDGIPSNGLVAHGALLSVVGTPAVAGQFLSSWSVDCENDTIDVGSAAGVPVPDSALGTLGDAGARFCLLRVTMNVSVSFTSSDIPDNYSPLPDIPAGIDVQGSTTDITGVCMAYGGSIRTAFGGTFCDGLFAEDPTLTCGAATGLAVGICGVVMNQVKACNDRNMVAQNLRSTTVDCGAVCTSGYAVGASCETSAVGLGGANHRAFDAQVESVAVLNAKKKSDIRFVGRSLGNSLAGGGFAARVLQNEFLPDVLPSIVPATGDIGPFDSSDSGDVQLAQDICTIGFKGTFNPAFGGLCIGIAEGIPFCPLFAPGTGGCAALFTSVRDCHDQGLKGGDARGNCADPNRGGRCPEGLTPFGITCVLENSGNVAPTSNTGELHPIVPLGAIGPFDSSNSEHVQLAQDICTMGFNGTFNPAFGGLCIGIAEGAPFCPLFATGPAGCADLFTSVRDCHLNGNEKGGDSRGNCGNPADRCVDGTIARGIQCIAPTASDIPDDVEGIFIQPVADAAGTLVAVSEGQRLEFGADIPLTTGQMVTITLMPAPGYHIAGWGGCESYVALYQSRSSETCVLTKGDDPLRILVTLAFGLLPAGIQPDGPVQGPGAEAGDSHCMAFRGTVQTALGGNANNYCALFAAANEEAAEDENIRTQCAFAGSGFVNNDEGSDANNPVSNNQRCQIALQNVRNCNKDNLRTRGNILSGSAAPTNLNTSGCDSGAGDGELCAPAGSPADVSCGDPCVEPMIAVGDQCVPPNDPIFTASQ